MFRCRRVMSSCGPVCRRTMSSGRLVLVCITIDSYSLGLGTGLPNWITLRVFQLNIPLCIQKTQLIRFPSAQGITQCSKMDDCSIMMSPSCILKMSLRLGQTVWPPFHDIDVSILVEIQQTQSFSSFLNSPNTWTRTHPSLQSVTSRCRSTARLVMRTSEHQTDFFV